MKIDEIKKLLKSGDVAGAEKAAQELLTAESDNVQAMMLYGACRQLQGDEATFRDAYRAVKEHLESHPDALDVEAEAAWKRFGALHAKLDQPELRRRGTLMEWTLVAILVATAGVAAGSYFGRDTQGLFGILGQAIWGSPLDPVGCVSVPTTHLYGGPDFDMKFIDIQQATTP